MATTYYHTVNGRIRGQSTAGVRTDYLTDALGSVVATVNSSAQVVNTYRYKPYGARLARTGIGIDPRFQWTGATGSLTSPLSISDQYNRLRHYATTQARWTSIDPLWPASPSYTYAQARPVLLTDPLGLFSYAAYSCAKHRYVAGYRIDVGNGDARGISSGTPYGPPFCQSAPQAISYCKSKFSKHKGRIAVVNGSFFNGPPSCEPISPVSDCLGFPAKGILDLHPIDVKKGAVQYVFSSTNIVWGRVLWTSGDLPHCNDQIPASDSRSARTILVEDSTGSHLYVLPSGATANELCNCFPRGSGGSFQFRNLVFDGGGSTQFYIEDHGVIKALVPGSRPVHNFFWIRELEMVSEEANEDPVL